MRIERKYLAHYIKGAYMENFVRLGKDLEEFTPEISAEVDTHRNILGQKRVIISGYDKTASVEPYYAEENDPLFNYLQGIIDGDAVMEDLKVQVVDVKLWETVEACGYLATMEEAYLEVTSYGGDHNGYRIGFKLHYTGIKKKGTFDIENNTFLELGE